MDFTKQVYESEAKGWQRGLYKDIKTTLRAPVVNSIWRIQMYHVPEFLRYAWGQIKPIFETQEFAAFTVAYRDTLISAVEDVLPHYTPEAVGISPSAFTELKGQVATFDIVAPRLLVLFKLMHRRLNGRPTGIRLGDNNATTAPFPNWLDKSRGRPPTMLSQDDSRSAIPESLKETLGDMVPSIYRLLAQWPSYLKQAWDDLEPIFCGDDYARAREEVLDLADTYLDRLPYTPLVEPKTLSRIGFDDETVTALQNLYASFHSGGTKIVPRLPIYAATVGAVGERDQLVFPQ